MPDERTRKRTIMIVDDHAMVRDCLGALLSREPGFTIVAQTFDGRDAVWLAQQHEPDVVLMDLMLHGQNGTEATHAIKKRSPNTKIVVLTAHCTEQYVRAALNAGADAYVLKGDSFEHLLVAIRIVLADGFYTSSAITPIVLARPKSASGVVTTWDRLTPREREVLKLVAERYTNQQIAKVLFLSTKTIDFHKTNVMKKLDLHTTSSLVAYAIENGLRREQNFETKLSE